MIPRPLRRAFPLVAVVLSVALAGLTAAIVVPNEIQQPGTQPGEVGNLEGPDKCDNRPMVATTGPWSLPSTGAAA
jgi:hypothetical protein